MAEACKNLVWLGMLILVLAGVPRSIVAQDLDEHRKATKKVEAVYSPIARQARLSGIVKMVVIVTPEGIVRAVRTVGGNPVLAAAAEDAVKQWKFEVAKRESAVLVAMSFGVAR